MWVGGSFSAGRQAGRGERAGMKGVEMGGADKCGDVCRGDRATHRPLLGSSAKSGRTGMMSSRLGGR